MSGVQEQDTGGMEPKDYWFEVALERGRALNEANENRWYAGCCCCRCWLGSATETADADAGVSRGGCFRLHFWKENR